MSVGKPIIQGSRGHLYFDGDELCFMALDTRVSGMSTEYISNLKADKSFVGGIHRDERNRGMRDVWLRGIPEKNWKAAVKMIRCRIRRILTEEEKQVLRDRIKPFQFPSNTPVADVESSKTCE